jgi:hypothetical protein
MLLFESDKKIMFIKTFQLVYSMIESELLALAAIFLGGFFSGIKINTKLRSLRKYEF